MSTPAADGGVAAVYNFWLGLIPQFFEQFGAGGAKGGATGSTAIPGLAFPADQVARAATMTQDALQSIANAYMPMLQAAGAPGLLGQWAATMMPFMAGMQAKPGAAAAPASRRPTRR